MTPRSTRKLIPLFMILCIVAGGFSILTIRHSSYHYFSTQVKKLQENAQAKKELGIWIVSDLTQLANLLNSIIITKNTDRQVLLKAEMLDLIAGMHNGLDVLTKGGKLVKEIKLNLPAQSSGSYTIVYAPVNPHSYNLEVLTLRPQLVELEKIIEQVIKATEDRNRILTSDDSQGIRTAAEKIALINKKSAAHILRMTETANKLAFDASFDLQEFKAQMDIQYNDSLHNDMIWGSTIIGTVLLLIGFIYRQILLARRTLEKTVSQLQQTEFELQATNLQVQTLNNGLEKQVEDRTQELQRYEQIVSTDTDLIAFFNPAHQYLAVNRRYSDYFGISVNSIVGEHISTVIGEELYNDRVKELLNLCLEGEILSFQPNITFPKRGKRLVKVTFTPYRDNTGSVTGVVSRAKDITEKVAQEGKLRLSEKVFQSTTEGITITDPEAKILAVNPAFSAITGYEEAEVIGQNPRILQSGRHAQDFYRQMWTDLRGKGQWQGEIWNQRKNGEVYPQRLTINAVHDELGKISNYVAVFTDISSAREAMEALEHQAHHHALTDLPNRLLLHARLKHSIEKAVRERQQGAVFYLDLDNFKNVNDSLGHTAGDQVLLEVANRLREQIREVDTVAHLSGDEFILVMDQVRSIHDAVNSAELLLQRLQTPITIQDYELFLSASLGITIFPQDGTSVENLLKNADAAMYKAKESGKNAYHIYSPALTEAVLERVSLESYLRRALEKQELVLHYQPQISLRENKIIAFEALIRWQHPELGLISPDKFIPLTEETGLIIPIGEWVLRTACRQLVDWRQQGYEIVRIAVNLSGRQIQQKDLHLMVARVLQETGCPADSLELEITEGFIMQHPEQSISVLSQIRALGVELSVDDFGTGHSSLNYLKRLPIHRLKVDRSFVSDIFTDAEDEAITKAIIALGHGLNLQITAEGIETEEQQQYLTELGCNEGQGYLISRPLPAALAEGLLKATAPVNRSSRRSA